MMKRMVIFIFLLAAVVAGFVALTHKTSQLTVWVFDIGQGDAIFIDGPEKQILIDGGPDTSVMEKLGAVMLPWDRTIDGVVLTHPHADHVMGLNAVVDRYDVGTVYGNLEPYDEPPAVAFAAATEMQSLQQGDVIDLGDGATLEVLWPQSSLAGQPSDDPNDGSVVLLLTYGNTTMLLTGDTGVEQEMKYLPHVPDIDVLKVGHHGSDTSTGALFLNIVRPEFAVISVGEGNSYGHPSLIVLHRLINTGANVFRTDVDGDVRFSSDGREPTARLFWL